MSATARVLPARAKFRNAARRARLNWKLTSRKPIWRATASSVSLRLAIGASSPSTKWTGRYEHRIVETLPASLSARRLASRGNSRSGAERQRGPWTSVWPCLWLMPSEALAAHQKRPRRFVIFGSAGGRSRWSPAALKNTADGLRRLPSSRASSVGAAGRNQPTVEFDVPNSTPPVRARGGNVHERNYGKRAANDTRARSRGDPPRDPGARARPERFATPPWPLDLDPRPRLCEDDVLLPWSAHGLRGGFAHGTREDRISMSLRSGPCPRRNRSWFVADKSWSMIGPGRSRRSRDGSRTISLSPFAQAWW